MIYNTTLASGSGNRWIDAQGRVLTAIGRQNLYVGKNVYTDGKVIYGYFIPSMSITPKPQFKVIPPAPGIYHGIPIWFHSSTDQSDREFTLGYFNQPPPISDESASLEMNKCPDVENHKGSWFNGEKLRFNVWYSLENSNYSHFIVDAKTNNWLRFPDSDDTEVAILDLNNAGCGAWVNGYAGNLSYIWVTNSDVTSGFQWKMDDIIEDLKADEEYDHSYTEVDPVTGEETLIYDKVEAQWGQWVEYYNHSRNSSGMCDYVVNARFSNETENAKFICDCCCEIRLVKTTGTEDNPVYETIYKYIDVHITGTSYSSHEHHRYSTIEIDDGFVYDGANRRMTVTWRSYDGNNYTHVFNGIPPSCRGTVIDGIPYIFHFSDSSGMYQDIEFYYQQTDSELYVSSAAVDATRLRYYNDLQVLADAWSYVPPEQQGQ